MVNIGRAVVTNEYIIKETHTDLVINNSNKGRFTILISTDDYEKCSKLKWNVQVIKYKDSETTYVYSSNNGKHTLLHRFILGITDDDVGDHINGDTLNNKRDNLRRCSHKENCRNRGENRNSSGYKGVLWNDHITTPKWMAYIKVDYKFKNLGYYDNIEDAINARKDAEEKYFGEYARC